MTNSEEGQRRYTTEEIVAALKKHNGLVSVAARALKCAPQTISIRAKKESEIRAAIEESRESLVDLAEQKLRAALNKGQPWAISLVLKTLGKERGYVERSELTGKNGTPIATKYDLSKLNDEQLKQLEELVEKTVDDEENDATS